MGGGGGMRGRGMRGRGANEVGLDTTSLLPYYPPTAAAATTTLQQQQQQCDLQSEWFSSFETLTLARTQPCPHILLVVNKKKITQTRF